MGVHNVGSSPTTPPFVGLFFFFLKPYFIKDVLTEYSKILIFLSIATFLALALVFLNWILVKKTQSFNKTSIYECGFDNFNSAKEKFTVHFYIIAILFVIFDIEMIFLYAMSYSIAVTKFFGLFILFFFLIILILGLIFEWNNGVLDWNKKTFNFFLFFSLSQESYSFFCDTVIFFILFFFFLILNILLIFNRTISNLLSLVFFLVSGCVFLLIAFKAEFMVYSYLLVYVGGISVLFLFGLMSVNQKLEYKRFGLIDFNKVILNLFSCILSFFIYDLVLKNKKIHDSFFFNSLNSTRELHDSFFFSNANETKIRNSQGYYHDLSTNSLIEGEIEAVSQYIYLGSNPYILLFSMFFLLVALIVSIELCLVNKKNN